MPAAPDRQPRSDSASVRVLVVRFGSLGDVILTTPLLRAIRRARPDARVTFVTKRAYAPLIAANPHVAEVAALEPNEPVTALARRLRGTRWEYRLDLHGSLRSRALRFLLGGRWSTWTKPRVRRAMLVRLKVYPLALPVPAAERYFDAARALGAVPDGRPAEFAVPPEAAARAAALTGGRRYVALCPGAAHRNKRWPAGHWRSLAGLLIADGQAVVGIGTAEEAALLDAPGVISGFGTDLPAAGALLAGAVAAVANDSGLMHLATAVGTPVVALFGPTSPALGYAPYRARAVVLERQLPCRPCSVYGGPHCPLRHHRCMIDLDPGQVRAALRSLA